MITGGMAAEYGDVQAGVINVVVREGSKDYHGSGEYRAILPGKKHWGVNVYDHPIHRDRMRWNDPAWANELHALTGEPFHMREDYTGLWGHFAEGSFSGPLTKKGSFFLSTAYIGEPATFPGADESGIQGVSRSADYQYVEAVHLFGFQHPEPVEIRVGRHARPAAEDRGVLRTPQSALYAELLGPDFVDRTISGVLFLGSYQNPGQLPGYLHSPGYA